MSKLVLDKIIILTQCEPKWKDSLKTVALHMIGGRVDSLIYINDLRSIHDEGEIKEDLMDELMDDFFDPDDIDIIVKEAYNGNHVIDMLADFVYDVWQPETMVMLYQPKEKTFNRLKSVLEGKDGNIYLMDYHDIFTDKKDTERDIEEIMRSVGIRTEYMLSDSYVSKGYFLGILLDILHSRGER
jgi:hypothetical protein